MIIEDGKTDRQKKSVIEELNEIPLNDQNIRVCLFFKNSILFLIFTCI
jgi:hypothetical protein